MVLNKGGSLFIRMPFKMLNLFIEGVWIISNFNSALSKVLGVTIASKSSIWSSLWTSFRTALEAVPVKASRGGILLLFDKKIL